LLSSSISNLLYLRDSHGCRHCKSRNNLTPHHVKFRSQGGTDNLDNLITLCMVCHNAVHAGNLTLDVISLENNNLRVHFTRNNGWKPY
jgi:5-methylcytosine-specific restriction endonuclease McrA